MTEVSRAERIFTGMLGIGMTFAVVGGAIIAALITGELLFGTETLNKGGASVIGLAFFGGICICFVMGALFGGLLALLARGRWFSQVSIAHVTVAGAVVGLVPAAIVELITLNAGKGPSVLPLFVIPRR